MSTITELKDQMTNFEEKINSVVSEKLPGINQKLEKAGISSIKLTDKESFLEKD